MAKRSYQQYCGLAAALDVVGERWALLVVRDLVPGPRRFTDLFDGLPGIATDVLADRLRSLEAAGAVEQQTLRHPVPAKVYTLTDRGRQLAGIGAELAGWGMPLLPPPSAKRAAVYRRNPRWALQFMARRYRGDLTAGEYRWTIDDEQLHVTVGGGGTDPVATLSYGHGPGTPLLDVSCTQANFFALLAGRRPSTGIRIATGDIALLESFLAALPLPSIIR